MRFAIVLVFLLCGFCVGCAVRAYKIPTAAMSPTINPGDGAIGDQISYGLGRDIKRFEIVVFNAPEHPTLGSNGENKVAFIFRIIGLADEKIEIRGGQIFVNDILLSEPFERVADDSNFGPIVVPEGQYFMLGDNRPNSWDSRYWKPSTIKSEDIYGRVVEILPGYYK